ncbi:NusA-like transcription termination signal-binding factor [Candidatus Woesearchaeota archaeon]|nr:NusA-like transcription termination signal-binding factor [Candidatus Woesearchaeota archaeon]
MTRIKYDINLIQYMSLFQTLTNSKVRDCFIDTNALLTFVVEPSQVGKAVGKRGILVKQIERALNRKIKIVAYNPTLVSFVRNIIYPLTAKEVRVEEGIVVVEADDSKTRGMLIGRNGQNLRNYESIAKRYFPELKEIKVA